MLQFVPRLEDTLKKMQDKVEKHATDFATKVLRELGLQDMTSMSVVKKIEDLFEIVEEEGHILVSNLMFHLKIKIRNEILGKKTKITLLI